MQQKDEPNQRLLSSMVRERPLRDHVGVETSPRMVYKSRQ